MLLGAEITSAVLVGILGRRRLVPSTSGVEARMIEAVLAIATALVVGSVLGAMGGLHIALVAAVLLMLGIGAAVLLRRDGCLQRC